MPDERCLYTLMLAPRERHEEILREMVAPVVRELDGSPELDSVFFARYNKPDWQLRFRVLGRPGWVDGPVRRLVESRVEALRRAGVVGSWEFAEYDREYERYGGEEGMRLAERIFHHDTVACLDLITAEARGALRKTRREYSLLMTERTLDLLGFDRRRRVEMYRYSYSWTIDLGSWAEEELRILEEKYRAIRDGLVDLFTGDQSRSAEAQWGGAEPARIALTCLERTRPHIEELLTALRDGRVKQEIVQLAWSYTHMHCNRLGIEAWPEAILRYYMHRFHEEALGTHA